MPLNAETERRAGTVRIRDFQPADTKALVDILKANQQYGHPEIDGPDAMLQVHRCEAAEFLVAERQGEVLGMIRGTYDGSRAVIYLASVDPDHQRQGIGRELVLAIAERFQKRGAGSLSVIVPGDAAFWRKIHFRQTTRVMQAFPLTDVLGQ